MTHRRTLLAALLLAALLPYIAEAQGHIYTKAATSGPDWTSTATAWTDIPDLELWFYQYDAGNACIGIAGEAYSPGNKRFFVRALIDGVPASPSDVVLCSEGQDYCRSFQFAATMSTGLHNVKFQAKVDAGGTATFGDRTMWVITAPTLLNIVAAPSGPVLTTTSAGFTDVDNMTFNINAPAAGPLVFTFSAEVFSDNGKRAFLRVTVDGSAAAPSDVVIADGYVAGVHSMTFVAPSVSAGSHQVKVQWSVDAGGTAYMGDRTLSVGAPDPAALAAFRGGIVSVSPPSGPPVTTTSSSFTTIPGLSATVQVPENGTLVVSVQGEVFESGGRTGVRAVVDGSVCSPADMVLHRDPVFSGTSSTTFVKKGVQKGAKTVEVQWLVDAGYTSSFGDRNMTVIALPANVTDLANQMGNLKPRLGTNPLLVLLWDPQRPTDPAPTVGAITNTVHGSYPSVADYYAKNSDGKFTVTNAGIFGWYASDKPSTFYWSADDPTDADHDGFTSGHVRKWWEAVTKADAAFNYASYDANNDGVLDPQELGIVVVIPQNSAFGSVRVPASQQYPTWQPLVVDGVRIPVIAEVYAGSPVNLGVFAHELGHLLLNLPDLYFSFFYPYAAGHYSIMDVTYMDSHLDPFHKIRLGWLQPTIVRAPGVYTVYPTEANGGAYILLDPHHGEDEYFIVENRCRSLFYDSAIADSGIAVWHVMEDPAVYGTVPAPAGVSAGDWASIPAGDWGRRAIRMIRPIYGPPFNNGAALWDGADPATGYDLLSNDANPAHARLVWGNGTASGFAMKNISPAAPVMNVTFELPATATGTGSEESIPATFALEQNYPNPFNPVTNIRYTIGSGRDGTMGARVRLSVYDVLGREVAVLVDEPHAPGSFEVAWNAAGFPTGVYFCRLTAGGSVECRKMLLLK